MGNWGTYTEKRVKEVRGKFIHTIKCTMEDGTVVYRWYVSVNRTNSMEYCLWKDKNSRGRKTETKYCMTRQEAIEKAESKL